MPTLEQVRNIEWSRTWEWELRFGGDKDNLKSPPAPFNDFFPAQDVELPESNIESFQFGGYNSTFSVPQGTNLLTLRTTFFDDSRSTMLRWVRDWFEDEVFGILGGKKKFVLSLESAVRLVTVTKFDESRQEVESKGFWVYPDGLLIFRGTSDSATNLYAGNFIIAGVVQ